MKNRIKVERAELDITQQQKNRFLPSTPLALKISRYFGKPVESIFILEETD